MTTEGAYSERIFRPVMFSLLTNDFPKSVRSAETSSYADDTTLYCVAEIIDASTNKLNNALADLKKWCDLNLVVPHPDKGKAMIMQRQPFIGPVQALRLGNNTIN